MGVEGEQSRLKKPYPSQVWGSLVRQGGMTLQEVEPARHRREGMSGFHKGYIQPPASHGVGA